MNVLSLFNGISCGRVVLEKAQIEVDNYYSSEIDKDAMLIADKNYPQDVKNKLGDVTEWKNWNLPKIDLILAGSPCQGFSRIGNGLNFEHKQSKLFFEFINILNWIKENNNPNVKFLLENVKMKQEWIEVINDYIGIKGKLINSNLFSAQNRERYYWTNIEYIQNINDKEIYIDDIIEKQKVEEGHYCKEHQLLHADVCREVSCKWSKGTPIYDFYNKSIKYGKSNTVVPHCFRRDRSAPNIIKDDYGLRRFTEIECERLQGLPDNYTNVKGVSCGNRYKAIGNGWNIDTIVHIIKELKIN